MNGIRLNFNTSLRHSSFSGWRKCRKPVEKISSVSKFKIMYFALVKTWIKFRPTIWFSKIWNTMFILPVNELQKVYGSKDKLSNVCTLEMSNIIKMSDSLLLYFMILFRPLFGILFNWNTQTFVRFFWFVRFFLIVTKKKVCYLYLYLDLKLFLVEQFRNWGREAFFFFGFCLLF